MRPQGVQGLRFVVYVYEDHSRAVVTLVRHLPAVGNDRRLGSIAMGVGRKDLEGLNPAAAVRMVCSSLTAAIPEPGDIAPRADGPRRPSGGHGGVVNEVLTGWVG